MHAAADEGERIRAERRQVTADYEARIHECRERFAVTACVDRAKARRRAALEELSRQQEVLGDAERRQRAAQRMKQINEKKTQAGAGRPARSVAKPPSVMVREPREPRPAASSPGTSVRPPLGSGPGAAQQAQNRQDYERRQREAQAHREEVEQRERQYQAQGNRPASGLPPRPDIPPASGAAR